MGEEGKRMEAILNSRDPDFLIEVFRTGSQEACAAASEILLGLPITKYHQLASALNDKNLKVRKWAVKTFGKSKEELFIQQISERLYDRSKEVSVCAYEALANILSPASLMTLLKSELENEKSDTHKKRLISYFERAVFDAQLSLSGISKDEIAELRGKKPLIKASQSLDKALRNRTNKICA
jgi:hypothetical protein